MKLLHDTCVTCERGNGGSCTQYARTFIRCTPLVCVHELDTDVTQDKNYVCMQDGVGISDFAFVFLEFAMMPKVPRDMATCRRAQDVVKHPLSASVQKQLPSLGFFPIPLDVRAGT